MGRIGLALALAASACGFQVGPAIGGDGGPTDGMLDSAILDDAGDAALDGAPDALPAFACDSANPDLRLCFAFDGSTVEGSSYTHTISTSGVAFGPGRRGQAAVFSAGDTFSVGASAALNVAVLTIKMWILPTELPAVRAGLLDSGGRYRLFLYAGGLIRCAITNGPTLTTSAAYAVPTGAWTQVTCMYDGSTMRIYVGEALAAQLAQSSSIPPISGGLVIGQNSPSGENFVGAIDELELWSSLAPP